MKFSQLKTTGLATTRLRLGLTQQQLSEQLGVSKATIGMAETGRRNLPVAALIRLAQLEIKMAGSIPPPQPANTIEAKASTESSYRYQTIEIRELECELQIQKLSGTLEKMTTEYKLFHTQLQLLDTILLKGEDPGDNATLGLQLHRDRLVKNLARCSPTNQSLLRNRIALLGAESHLNKSVRQQMISE